MTQMTLLTGFDPPAIPGITIHCGDVSLVLEERGAALVMADPPWSYTNTGTPDAGFNGTAAGQYDCPSMVDIVTTLDRSFDCARENAYLFCWATWPMLVEFILEAQRMRWRYLTGGSWHKTGGLGVGFHVRGDSEPWLLFAKGKPHPSDRTLSNAFQAPRSRHSEKPVKDLCRVMECLTDPGDLVLSLYSGMCPEARAAKLTGRRLIGAELDPERHAMAMGLLASCRV